MRGVDWVKLAQGKALGPAAVVKSVTNQQLLKRNVNSSAGIVTIDVSRWLHNVVNKHLLQS